MTATIETTSKADYLIGLCERVAALAEQSLQAEVCTWPKPGLVSHIDNGSHGDMDLFTFSRSARALRPFFFELAKAGCAGSDMIGLRKIGLSAERAMLAATAGVNTHRGAIFGLGLLSAAAGARASFSDLASFSLGQVVQTLWGTDIVAGPRQSDSHGAIAGHRYGVQGARGEAASGFPNVYEVALPALRGALNMRGTDPETARIQACFALIAALDDTNLLHRGGKDGLGFAQREARRFLACGGVAQPHWRAYAHRIHLKFIARHLSPGGAADLLAMALFVDSIE